LGAGALSLGVGVFTLGKGFEVFFGQVNKLPKAVETLSSLAFQLSGLLLVGATLAPSMIAVGLALLPLALGIGAIGLGLAAMNKNFKVIGKMTTELVEFSGAILDLVLLGSVFSGFLITTGLAIMPVGVGIALLGVGLLSMGFGLEKIRKEADGLGMLAAQLGLFSSAMGVLGLLAGGGILAIGAAFVTLGLGLLAVGFGLDSVKKGIRGIGADAGQRIGEFLFQLGMGLASMVGPGSLAGVTILGNMAMSGLPDLIESAVKLTPEKVTAVGQVVDHAGKYAEIQRTMRPTAEDSFAGLLSEVKKMAQGAGGGGGSKTIVLKIGEREFARAVIDAIEDYNELEI